MKSYESRTKLLLSGEYTVLKGALALALPLKFGQRLEVESSEGAPMLKWESKIGKQSWFTAQFSIPDLDVNTTNLPAIALTLGRILKLARKLNPNFLISSKSYCATSWMDFNPDWGLGSSSTLISNIAYWAGCDPFELNRPIFNGSGYDIACARSTTPIFYQLKEGTGISSAVQFRPKFHPQLYFLHLNSKQNSRESIQKLKPEWFDNEAIESISAISAQMAKTTQLECFQSLMQEHEALTGRLINKTPIQKEQFQDFKGAIKSLGAWGGDMVLVASTEPEEYVREYFTGRAFPTLISYETMTLGTDKKEAPLSPTPKESIKCQQLEVNEH